MSEDEEKGGHEEDVSPGGDYVKLLLLAKPFSPTFRENWELYRTEYWERENERRALLRSKLKDRDRKLLKEHGAWFWWLPWRKAALLEKYNRATHITGDPEKIHHHGLHPRHIAVVNEHRRTRSSSVRRGSMSGASSRSPTPSVEVDEAGVSRKASTASNTSDKRRKKLNSGSFSKTQRRPVIEGRSLTPDIPSPLARESSAVSSGSEE